MHNEDTGELLCEILPVFGTDATPMNEQEYLYLPPCMWGSADEGLRPPPTFMPDSKFRAVKHVNSSVYHYGVMAIFQMHASYVE